MPQTLSLGYIARTFWLAGRTDEALALLRSAARVCVALDQPYLHAEAEVLLGQALDRAGDKAGACAAWKTVVDPWGAAKPRSVHAETAKALAAKAACK
jgi:serine/threonine-protein kinase